MQCQQIPQGINKASHGKTEALFLKLLRPPSASGHLALEDRPLHELDAGRFGDLRRRAPARLQDGQEIVGSGLSISLSLFYHQGLMRWFLEDCHALAILVVFSWWLYEECLSTVGMACRFGLYLKDLGAFTRFER